MKVCRKLLRLGDSCLIRLILNKLKKRKEELWLNLPLDVLGIIFNKLKKEKQQGSCRSFAQVCRCWREIAIAYDESSWVLRSSSRGHNKSILLMQSDCNNNANVRAVKLGYYMFSSDGGGDDDEEDEGEKKDDIIIIEKNLGLYEPISSCRGGWILLSSTTEIEWTADNNNLKLWNPFFDVKISLPYFPSRVAKAITFFGHNFGIGVAVISIDGRFAFVKCGDFKWTYLFCEGDQEGEKGFFDYEDLISSQDSILAISLSKNEGESSSSIQIQAWNFEGTNILDLNLDFPQDIDMGAEDHNQKKYTHKLYIAESRGTVFLVVRLINKTVKWLNSETRTEYCETINFYVYVLDEKKTGWSRLKNLGDQALFIGKNQTMLLQGQDYYFQGCRKNSIYFRDHYWELIKSDNRRHGEFYGYVGAFYLEDSSVQKCQQEFYKSSPSFWIISGV